MQVINNKVLVVRTKFPSRITQTIKKSKVVQKEGEVSEVAVNWGLEEAQTLRTLNLKNVPSPIVRDYAWPGAYPPMSHQKDTASFLTLHRRAFCFNEQGCVDSETEYLSPTGWKKISEYKEGMVAQYNPDTKTVEFVEPKEYVKLSCVEMVKIKTHYGLDQLLSPEHRVLLVDGKNNSKTEVTTASEVLARHDKYFLGYKNTTGGTRLGTSKISFSAMAIPTAFTAIGGGGIPLTEAQIRLQIAVIADGHIGSTTRCTVRIKKERKINRLRALLEAAEVDYTETTPEYKSAKGFHVFKFYAPLTDKSFDAKWWAASQAQLKIIVDEVLNWDGCTTKGKRFSTYVKESADFIQYAFCATNHTARLISNIRQRRDKIETEYIVQVRDTQRLFIRGGNQTVEPALSTDGFKYCFMVPSTFLVFRRNGCVFLSGNTGKTASAIWAADYLMEQGLIRRVLIICPLSIMQASWQSDLFKCAVHRHVGIAHGSRAKRKAVIESTAEFVVINYDGVETVAEDVAKDGRFDLIIVDEANAYKNVQTKRWKALKALVSEKTWLWMMTGTPAAQSPTDAYGLAKMAVPDNVPRFFGAFRDMVMVNLSRFKWVPKPGSQQTVFNALQPAIRFTKEQCIDLPDITYTGRQAPLTAQQEKYYKILKDDMLLSAAGEEVSTVNAATNLNKLLQISGGAVYTDAGNVIEFDVSNRLSVVQEVIDEASHKVLVFVPFTHTIQLLKDYLSKSGIQAEVINGQVPVSKRTEIFKRFQEEVEPKVLLIQPQAAAHGVTLTAANVIIWYAPVTSIETYLQANARIHRQGQKNPMTVVHISGSEVEKKLYKMLQGKLNTHTQLVDLYKSEISS